MKMKSVAIPARNSDNTLSPLHDGVSLLYKNVGYLYVCHFIGKTVKRGE